MTASPCQVSVLPNAMPSDPGAAVNQIACGRGRIKQVQEIACTNHSVSSSLESTCHTKTDVNHPVLGREAGLGPNPASSAFDGWTYPHLIITGDTAWRQREGEKVSVSVC